MVRPVAPQHRVTLGYRQRANFDPNYKHRGIDYGCPVGTPVVATTAGTVIYAADARPRGGGYGPAFGIHVVIRTGDTWHLYGHLSAEIVTVGQFVSAGQQIGRSGATGNVTGAHLHYAEFTQGPAAWQSDRAPRFIDAGAPAPVNASTVFDLSFWAQAHAPWFGRAWAPRSAGIIRELRGSEVGTEASIHVFTEVFTAEQVGTIQTALGPDFRRANRRVGNGGPAGLEIFYADAPKWESQRIPVGYASGVANRSAFVQHLVRPTTGDHVAIVAAHAPIKKEAGNAGKARYSRWLAGLVQQIDGPVILPGDFNDMPMAPLTALGFRDFRAQADIANEGAYEFPSARKNYSTILTIPSQARITGGQVDNTSLELSDHRRIEARVVVP
jgi:hypothetical protein